VGFSYSLKVNVRIILNNTCESGKGDGDQPDPIGNELMKQSIFWPGPVILSDDI
jgi:hypothetical protein